MENPTQNAAKVTYSLILRWLCDLPGWTVAEIARELSIEDNAALKLMQRLEVLPYTTHIDGRYSINLDYPLWKLGQLPVTSFGWSCRTSLIVYLVVSSSLAMEAGITTGQLCSVLKVSNRTILTILNDVSSSESGIPIWKDRYSWKVVLNNIEIVGKHSPNF